MPNSDFLDWDATISDDGEYSEFVLLEPGDYNFEVTGFERTTAKTSGAPMAVLTLKVHDEEQSATVMENLVLQKNCEWKLSQFFRSIGLKKHGEPLKMDWLKVKGATGRCKVVKNTFTGKDGIEKETNDVDRFYDPLPSNDELPW